MQAARRAGAAGIFSAEPFGGCVGRDMPRAVCGCRVGQPTRMVRMEESGSSGGLYALSISRALNGASRAHIQHVQPPWISRTSA